MRIFIRAPTGCNSGKKETESEPEKEEYGICVCCVCSLVCTAPPPPHLSPILSVLPHPPAAMDIRIGGTVGRPPPATHIPFSTVKGHSGGSLGQPLIRKL
jgi:hypothetical protein